MAKAKMLTPEEIAAVLHHVEAESRYPERDRVMVLLSVRAGLRAIAGPVCDGDRRRPSSPSWRGR